MNTSVLNTIRTAKGFSRGIAYLIIVAIVGVVLERVIYYTLHKADIIEAENAIEKLYRIAPHKARQLKLASHGVLQPGKTDNSTKLSQSVLETKDTLDVLAYELHRDNGNPDRFQARLTNLYNQLHDEDKKAMAGFRKVARHIEQHNLGNDIKQRHDTAVFNYRKDMDKLFDKLNTAIQAQDPEDKLEFVMEARKFLQDKQLKRTPQPFDPNNLPYKSLQPRQDNQPKLKEEQFIQAGLYSTPYAQYAALGDFTYGNLPGASNPIYLAESTEVKITQAIKDQAQALNYDPVKIYYWVRNNIEWLPTWGSMQDADITLGSKRGNSMDISSLLVALLRASKIPARYAYGSIVVPAKKFRNWAGPFTEVRAAATFAASGGVPLVAQVEGGQVKAVRMEHIWVESAIDYHPSRGARNIDADSWIAMDASFKQYEDLQGLDVAAVSGIDGQAVADSFVNSATVNDAESWISGIDASILETNLTSARTSVENYVSTNLPNATVGDVIGGRKIIAQQADSLPSSLPNEVLLTGARYGELPAGLQAHLTVALGRDILGYPIGEVTLPWAKINNHKLTLSFKPATTSDEAAIQSYMPTGQVTDISQLPNSMPAYLVNVIPEIKLDGAVISEGQVITLGQEIDFNFGLKMPGVNLGSYNSPVLAGSYMALAMTAGSVSLQRLNEVQDKINNTKAIIESGDITQIESLTREDLLGDMFYSGVLGYYSQAMSMGYISGLKQHASQQILLSGGTYGYVPKVQYFFGLPRSIQNGGVEMDLDNISTVTTTWDGDSKNRFNMIRQTGVIFSALEHGVPEQMFSSPGNPSEGVSAVKLLAKANRAGQRIYHITQANMASVLPNLNLSSDVINDIQSGLYAGKEVITHTDNLTVNGYTGAGYIIYDPVVGDGAYKIGGGLNGGLMFVLLGIIMFAIAMIIAISLGGFLGALLLGWEIFGFLSWVNAIANAQNAAEFNQANAGAFLVAALGFLTPLFVAGGAAAVAAQWFGMIFGTMLTNPFGWFY